jgi:hypothetical protein
VAAYRDRAFDDAVAHAASLPSRWTEILDDRPAGLEGQRAALPSLLRSLRSTPAFQRGKPLKSPIDGPDFGGARRQFDGLLDRSAHD